MNSKYFGKTEKMLTNPPAHIPFHSSIELTDLGDLLFILF